MYIEPSGLKQMLDSIITHHESGDLGISKQQQDKLAELVQVKAAREKQWQEAYSFGRELEALARRYITKYLLADREYRLLYGEPPA